MPSALNADGTACLMQAPVENSKQTFYPDVRTLAGFGREYFEHIGSEIHQELHSSFGPADVVQQLFITGVQAVSQPVFTLQNGRQVSQLSVQQL